MLAYESDWVPLAVLAAPDKVIETPFAALYRNEVITVTAVLNRTCVYYSGIEEFDGQPRWLARLDEVWVDARRLTVRPLGHTELANHKARLKGQLASRIKVSGGDFS